MAYRDPLLQPAPTTVAQGPEERRWWRLLDALPHNLGTVHCWNDPQTISDDDVAEGHMHANPTTIVCLAGVVRVSRPGSRIDLAPGEVLLIAPGIWHNHEELRAGAVRFGQGFLAAWSDVVLGDRAQAWTGRVPSQPSRRLVKHAVAATDQGKRQAAVAALLAQVLAESVAHQAFAHPALRAMLARMWEGLHRGVTVDDLVTASGLSRAQAYRVFVAGYGVPPKEALATSRLWLAAELLAAGVPVAATAERCGFPSTATFTRMWKREHGHSPGRGGHGPG